MSNLLEEEFYRAMVNIYTRCKDEIDYKPTRYLQMVNEHGGVKAAKELINSKEPRYGFVKVWELGRLDLTVEALVQDPKWVLLFTADEIEKARKCLDQYK